MNTATHTARVQQAVCVPLCVPLWTTTCGTRHVGRASLAPRFLRGRDTIPVLRAESDDNSTNLDKENAPGAGGSVEDEPVWVRRERERQLLEAQGGAKELPFGVYLLLSAIVCIAAVGSVFEFTNKNPIFDVIYPDSPLYAPILGVFALTGLPTAGYLFIKAVSAANAEAERMDELDGVSSKENYFNRKDE